MSLSLYASEKSETLNELVEKAYEIHLVDENDAFKQSPGRFISLIPGFPAWYNLKYDEDDDVIYVKKMQKRIAMEDARLLIVNPVFLTYQ